LDDIWSIDAIQLTIDIIKVADKYGVVALVQEAVEFLSEVYRKIFLPAYRKFEAEEIAEAIELVVEAAFAQDACSAFEEMKGA
jgi:hypothetical protein